MKLQVITNSINTYYLGDDTKSLQLKVAIIGNDGKRLVVDGVEASIEYNLSEEFHDLHSVMMENPIAELYQVIETALDYAQDKPAVFNKAVTFLKVLHENSSVIQKSTTENELASIQREIGLLILRTT